MTGITHAAGLPAAGILRGMSPVTWSVPALLLALVLVVSGIAKVRDPQSTQESFHTLRLPLWLTRSAAPRLLPWAEIVLAGGLLLTSGWVQVLVALAAIALFTAYLVLIVRASRFPDKVECGCLGKLGLGTVGTVTIVRNVLLLALAAATLAAATLVDPSRAGSVIARLVDADAGEWGWLAAVAVAILVTGLMTYASGSGPAAEFPEEEVPEEFVEYERRPTPTLFLTDIHGDRHNLVALAAAQARLVIYGEMRCGGCLTVLETLPAFQAANPEIAVHVLVDSYDMDARAKIPAELAVFVDPELIFVQFFQLKAPGAVLFGADGLLAGGPASGKDAVLALLAEISDALAEARGLTGTETPR